MSPKLDLSYYCTEEAILASTNNDDVDKCTNYMDTRFVHDQLQECKANFTKLPEEFPSCTVKFNDWEQMYKSKSAKKSPSEGHCTDKSTFYLQSPCIVRESHIPPIVAKKEGEKVLTNKGKRQLFGLMVGCLGVFVYLYTIIFMDYIKQVQVNKFIDFDVKTITAGDYSIEFDISPEVYDKWKNHYCK